MAGESRPLFVLFMSASLIAVASAYSPSFFTATPLLRGSGQCVALGGVSSFRPLLPHSTQARKRNQPCAVYMRRKTKSDVPKQKAGNIFKEIHNIDQGCVLVASADEVDHFFRRGVALVLDHGPQGSRGLLLEMATAFTMGEMAPSLKGTPLENNPLFRGGDSGEDKVLMIHSHPSVEGSVRVGQTGICVGGIADALKKIEAGELVPEDFKFVFNQVEWTAGQLEAELSQGLWRAGIAVPELCTRQVGSQSERDQLFGGVKFDSDRSLWDILTSEMGDVPLEAREVQYSRGRTPAPHIIESKKLLFKLMIERVFEFRNKRDAASIIALLDGGAEVLGKRGSDGIEGALVASWADPFWQAELDKDSVTVDEQGNVRYEFIESGAESAGGKAAPLRRKGVALLSESGLIRSIHEPQT